MKMHILKSLTEHPGEWLSGEDLCRLSGVTRSAVWKQVRQLKDEGYAIESLPSKGYRMLTEGETLSREGLQLALAESEILKDVIYLKTVDSTNRYARGLDEAGVLIVANEQTQGRGRLGRSWHGPAGEGLWFSLVLRPNMDPSQAAMVTQIAASAVWQGIFKVTGIEASIKWPNDIQIGPRKLCGILTEMNAELGAIQRLVVGIGINVNNASMPAELSETATSLMLETDRKWSRKALLVAVLKAFEADYLKFINEGDVTSVIRRCREHSSLLGKPIRILTGSREEFADAVDISDKGELIVRKASGELAPLISGEISVRVGSSD